VHEREIHQLNQRLIKSEDELAEYKEMVEHLSFENQRIVEE
jgi:hypothetical protein